MKEYDLPYRDAAAVMLLNEHRKVFVALRIDNAAEAWQMPQGGLEKGEDPEAGMLRELQEETSIRPDLVQVITRARRTFLYDLPEDLVGKVWKGKYRGQRQHWFLARFLGSDADVNLDTPEPEFRGWRWAEPAELPRIIVPFKRKLYEDVLDEFADHLL